MTHILNFEEYMTCLASVMELPPISAFAAAIEHNPSLMSEARVRRHYGLEMVTIDRKSKNGESRVVFLIRKDDLINRIIDFITENDAVFPIKCINGLSSALREAALVAETAEIFGKNFNGPDPRYKTCTAVASGLGTLASLYADSVQSEQTARQCMTTLLDLGINNHNIHFNRLTTQDSGIIGYSYLCALLRLAHSRHTAPLLATVMAQKQSGPDPDAASYIAAVAFCALSLADTRGEDNPAAPTLRRLSNGFDVAYPMYLLTEGLKIEEPDSPAVEVISSALSGILLHNDVRGNAGSCIRWLDERLTAEGQSPHTALLGNHLPVSTPIVVKALRRALDRFCPFPLSHKVAKALYDGLQQGD